MSNVINFPKNKKWILNFIIPDEISMEGQSPDIHWTFEQNYGTAEVIARSLEEAKKKILDFDQADAIAVAKDIANQIMTKREKFNIPADDLEFINQHVEVIEKNSDYLGK